MKNKSTSKKRQSETGKESQEEKINPRELLRAEPLNSKKRQSLQKYDYPKIDNVVMSSSLKKKYRTALRRYLKVLPLQEAEKRALKIIQGKLPDRESRAEKEMDRLQRIAQTRELKEEEGHNNPQKTNKVPKLPK